MVNIYKYKIQKLKQIHDNYHNMELKLAKKPFEYFNLNKNNVL